MNDITNEFCYYDQINVKDYGRGNLLISHNLYKKIENYKVVYLNHIKINIYDVERLVKELNSIGFSIL